MKASEHRVLWQPIVIVLAGMLAYANALHGPFILDDQNSIVDNAAIRHLAGVGLVLQEHDTPIAGRPVVALSFAIDYAVGGLSVLPYRLTNIAIHLLCALLVFGIARRTLSLAGMSHAYARRAGDLAFAIALVWVVHPLNSEPVDYLTQRTESLMALFFLLTLYAAIRSVMAERGFWWEVLAMIACGLGMASKESMVVAPAMVLLYDRVFLFPSLTNAVAARWRLYGMLASSWLVFGFLVRNAPRGGTVILADGQTVPYLLNQARLIVRYFRLTVWPSDLVVNYGPVAPVQFGDVLPQAIALIAVLAISIVALVRRPRLGFLPAWIVITLAPTSSIIPIVSEVGAERRMYLPLVAVVALGVIGLYSVDTVRRRVSTVGAAIALTVVTAALGLATAARNREYSTGFALAESVLRRWPTDVAHGMVGVELMRLHRDAEAVAELRLAARTDPRSRYNLGAELFNTRNFAEAARELTGLADEYPLRAEIPGARRLAGRAYMLERDWPRAISQLTQALSMAPTDVQTRQWLVDALNAQSVAFVDAGRPADAVAILRRAATLDPRRVDVQDNLAAAFMDSGDPESAEREARRAIAIDPSDPESYDLLGRSLALQGKTAAAVTQLNRALELSPHNARFEEDLNRVRAILKR